MWLISPPPTTVKVCGVVRDDRRGRSSPWIQLFGHPLGFVPFFALYESVHSFFTEIQVEIQLSCLATVRHTHTHTHTHGHTHEHTHTPTHKHTHTPTHTHTHTAHVKIKRRIFLIR